MIAMVNGKTKRVPLGEVAGRLKTVDPDCQMIKEAKRIGISFRGLRCHIQALYRKFRPQEFDDVKGQEHIVTTLKNQIKADRIGHAYLFCGTRGTGKTTIAKIFAKAVNCEHPVDGSPCGECPTCKAIAGGQFHECD